MIDRILCESPIFLSDGQMIDSFNSSVVQKRVECLRCYTYDMSIVSPVTFFEIDESLTDQLIFLTLELYLYVPRNYVSHEQEGAL